MTSQTASVLDGALQVIEVAVIGLASEILQSTPQTVTVEVEVETKPVPVITMSWVWPFAPVGGSTLVILGAINAAYVN